MSLFDTHTLTKDDIRALREATQVSIHHNTGRYPDGSVIRLGIPLKSPSYVSLPSSEKPTAEYEIALPSNLQDGNTAFTSITCPQQAQTWKFVVHSLKTGDELRLRFHGDHQTEWLAGNGLFADTLSFIVYRNKRQHEVDVVTEVAPAQHRMIT